MNIMKIWYIFFTQSHKYPPPPIHPWNKILRSPNYIPPRVFLENKTKID
jgi:hypothetical protein